MPAPPVGQVELCQKELPQTRLPIRDWTDGGAMCDFLPFIIEVLKHVCRKWTSFENFLDPPCVVLAFLVLLGGPSFGSTPHTPTKQRRSPTITSMLETTLSSIESNIIDCSFSRFQSLLPGSAISWSCNYPTTELHPPALSATIRRTICIQHDVVRIRICGHHNQYACLVQALRTVAHGIGRVLYETYCAARSGCGTVNRCSENI